jgi:hypothetical protein
LPLATVRKGAGGHLLPSLFLFSRSGDIYRLIMEKIFTPHCAMAAGAFLISVIMVLTRPCLFPICRAEINQRHLDDHK